MADYAVFLLNPDGQVVSWNEGAERIKGWRPEEILGEHLSRFSPPEEAAAGRPAEIWQAAARDGRAEDEGWRVRKDGSRFWANMVVTAICDEAGTLWGFAKVTRDLNAGWRCWSSGMGSPGGCSSRVVQGLFAVGLELQAATFADSTLRAKVDAAVQHLDQVIVDLRSHVFQLRS